MLSPGIAALWERREAKAGLSVERIVEAAVELADEQGLEAVSMTRVAKRVGFTTMALYRHVQSKDELLVLMMDVAIGEPPAIDPADGWRPGLERWALAVFGALMRHPWAVRVPITGPPMTPNQLGWLERGLAVLAETPLTEQEKGAALLLLNGHAFSGARLATEIVPEQLDGAAVLQLADPERFPALRRALEAGIFEDDSGQADFEFGLQRLLDGIEAKLSR